MTNKTKQEPVNAGSSAPKPKKNRLLPVLLLPNLLLKKEEVGNLLKNNILQQM